MPDPDRDWRKWGREDPYFGVLAHPRFASGSIAANWDVFFASGQQFIDQLLAERSACLGAERPRRALDHGCGTGRLTIPLSRACAEVTALDVAPEMLAEARRNADAAGRSNIAFHLADDRLSAVEGSFDLVVSHLVLQHVPVARGLIIFDQLLARLAPGGWFHISVSVRTDAGRLRWLYWASATIPGVKIIQNVLRGERWNAPAMQMNDYPIGQMLATLSRRGVQRLGVTIDPPHPRFQTVSLSGVRTAH